MPDVHEVGQVTDIDGLTVAVSTERGRIRLEAGRTVLVFGHDGAEEFDRLWITACWEAAQYRAPAAGPQVLGVPPGVLAGVVEANARILRGEVPGG